MSQQCKGFNRDGSKCSRKTRTVEGNYCWQHCEQFLDQGVAAVAPKKVFKMPVEISIDNYQVEIDSLKSDVEFMTKKFEAEGAEPETLEDLAEFAHKTFRMQELCKEVGKLEQKKKDNFKEEKQFRVLVHNVPKNQSFQAPQTDRLVESAGFKRAIDFEIRKLNSRQKKLDNKRKAIKDVKSVKNVEDD